MLTIFRVTVVLYFMKIEEVWFWRSRIDVVINVEVLQRFHYGKEDVLKLVHCLNYFVCMFPILTPWHIRPHHQSTQKINLRTFKMWKNLSYKGRKIVIISYLLSRRRTSSALHRQLEQMLPMQQRLRQALK